LNAATLNVEAISCDFKRAAFGFEVIDHAFAAMALNFEAVAYDFEARDWEQTDPVLATKGNEYGTLLTNRRHEPPLDTNRLPY
jgi:hypothetical protein